MLYNIYILFKKVIEVSVETIVVYLCSVLLLQRHQRLAETVYHESQSGNRSSRSTVDGIFSLRQIMKKCREHRRNLHVALIDFTKAFYCVNRELLLKILEKLGCPGKFIIKKLYSDIHARLIIDAELSNPMECKRLVKQGCKFAPTVFGIHAAVILYLALRKISQSYCSIKVRFRYDGDLFDLRRLKSKTKTLTKYIREA